MEPLKAYEKGVEFIDKIINTDAFRLQIIAYNMQVEFVGGMKLDTELFKKKFSKFIKEKIEYYVYHYFKFDESMDEQEVEDNLNDMYEMTRNYTHFELLSELDNLLYRNT